VEWSGISFRRLHGSRWCSYWTALNSGKTNRHCPILSDNKKFLYQSS
jgi:hypothetical protein